jgi:hypothetical protein
MKFLIILAFVVLAMLSTIPNTLAELVRSDAVDDSKGPKSTIKKRASSINCQLSSPVPRVPES